MSYQTTKLNENENATVTLDDQKVTISEFNDKVSNLNGNQRIVETSKDTYHLVERMQG